MIPVAAAAPYVADALVLLGVLIVTVGVYGAFRMPDIYTRLHATSVVVAFGVIAITLAAMFTGVAAIQARAALVVAILAITAPVATFAMARAAFLRDEKIAEADAVDESGHDLTAEEEERPEG